MIILSSPQAAKLMKLSNVRVIKLCEAGRFPGAYRDDGIRRLWKIPLEDIEKRTGKRIKVISGGVEVGDFYLKWEE